MVCDKREMKPFLVVMTSPQEHASRQGSPSSLSRIKTQEEMPGSYFVDVKCPGCYNITTNFSHAQRAVLCVECSAVLCQPTGGKTRVQRILLQTEAALKVLCIKKNGKLSQKTRLGYKKRERERERERERNLKSDHWKQELCKRASGFFILHTKLEILGDEFSASSNMVV